MKTLIEFGADVNSRGETQRTPLIFAAARPDIENKNNVEHLIKLGADVNAIDEYGKSALMYALKFNHGTASLLIKYGADLSAINKKGESVYDIAVKHCPEIVNEIYASNSAKKSIETVTHKVTNNKVRDHL